MNPELLLSFSFLITCGIIVVMLIGSALVSGAEVAFFSLSPKDVEELKESKSKVNLKIVELLNNPQRLLATILISNNLINVGVIILSSSITEQLLPSGKGETSWTQILLVTFVILLVGEVIPKIYASKYSLKIGRLMVYPLSVAKNIFALPSTWLIRMSDAVEKRFKKKNANIAENELEQALELTVDSHYSEEEKKILKGIVTFGNTDVKQIMTSRVDVIAFDVKTSYDEVIEEIIKSGFSRIPIFEDSFDKIVGILYIKDLLKHLGEDNFDWTVLIRSPFFVPENKKIDNLLKEFQDTKVHLAIVVDEYGGTSGVITLEDIIEEVVGDISDEFDDDELVYRKIDENNYVFEGKTPLVDMYKVLGIEGKGFEEKKGESDSLAGFLIELSGKILQKTEQWVFEQYTFTIEASDQRRIKQVKVTIDDKSDLVRKSGASVVRTIVVLCLFFLGGCGHETNIPKPYGFIRVEYPDKEYKSWNPICKFKAEIPSYAVVETKQNSDSLCYNNIQFPDYKATLYLTYISLESDLELRLEQSAKMVYEHEVRASSIKSNLFINPEKRVFGTLFDLKGNVATPIQFYATDSLTHFVRGSLYFNVRPNYDSLRPVIEYVRKDIEQFLNTVQWQSDTL